MLHKAFTNLQKAVKFFFDLWVSHATVQTLSITVLWQKQNGFLWPSMHPRMLPYLLQITLVLLFFYPYIQNISELLQRLVSCVQYEMSLINLEVLAHIIRHHLITSANTLRMLLLLTFSSFIDLNRNAKKRTIKCKIWQIFTVRSKTSMCEFWKRAKLRKH